MTRQQQIDWDDAARKGAAKDRRILLTRIKQALAGRTLGDPSEPRSCVSGAVVAVVLDGLHGWCVSDGRTDRKPGEIGQPYSESRAKRALAYLQSPDAECCVAVEPFRSHGSPRNWRSICWSNLHAWCERLEANPVVRKSSPQPEQLVATTGAERDGHRCGPHGSTGAERDGHRCGPHRSYKEDGPLDGPDGPPHGATELLSETDELETITRGGDEKSFDDRVLRAVLVRTTKTRRHDGGHEIASPHGAAVADVSAVRGVDHEVDLPKPGRAYEPGSSGRPCAVQSVDCCPLPGIDDDLRRLNETTEAQRHGEGSVGVDGDTPLAAAGLRVVRSGPKDQRLVRFQHMTDGSSPSPVPSVPLCLRSEIESILKDQLGVDGAVACVDIALRSQSLDQIAEVVQYAAGLTIGDVRAWGPGAVFLRVTRPPSDAQGPADGWAKKRPEWILAKGRQAARERQEREERRQDAERQLRQRRREVEAFYGPVIDRLYREDKAHIWGLMTQGEKMQLQACGGSFTSRGAREIFLLAAIEGRFSE